MPHRSFLGCADLPVVRACFGKAERGVGATAHIVGIVVVLTIVFPEASGTDAVAAASVFATVLLSVGDVTTATTIVRYALSSRVTVAAGLTATENILAIVRCRLTVGDRVMTTDCSLDLKLVVSEFALVGGSITSVSRRSSCPACEQSRPLWW